MAAAKMTDTHADGTLARWRLRHHLGRKLVVEGAGVRLPACQGAEAEAGAEARQGEKTQARAGRGLAITCKYMGYEEFRVKKYRAEGSKLVV